jgi:uncharacterized protein HemX
VTQPDRERLTVASADERKGLGCWSILLAIGLFCSLVGKWLSQRNAFLLQQQVMQRNQQIQQQQQKLERQRWK